MITRTTLVVAVSGIMAVAWAAGCSSSAGGGGSSISRASTASGTSAVLGGVLRPGFTAKGGTVNILAADDFEHLDPVQNYVTNSGEFGKLIYRTLTVIKDAPGQKPEIEPDLAADLGTQSDGGKTWTYKLRTDVKFEDGTPITSQDIKYNVERSFAQDIYKDGATYMPDLLANTNGYRGPYANPNKDLTAVQTPDDTTIVFHFTGPTPDANWILSLFYTAPVPKAKDTKQNYDFSPVSSGPYKIQNYTPKKSLTLVRNTNWDPASDPNRPALPDGFKVTFGIDLPTISQRLIANQGDDQTATTLENSGALQNGDLPKIRDASVKARFTNGATPCVDYEWINTQKITDPDVRNAIETAINREAIQTTYGGDIFGTTVDTIVSPTLQTTIPGFKPAALGLKPTGDPAAAKALLAGKTVPPLHYGVANTSVKQKTVATQIQNDLKNAGVTMVIDQIPTSSYYKTIRGPNPPDIGRAGWCWDWPTMASVTPAVLGGNADLSSWNSSNFSRTDDKMIFQKIQALANSTDNPSDVASQFNAITNQQLSSAWPLLPTVALNDPNVVGGKLRNVGVSTVLGTVDLNTIGVAS